MIESGGPSRQQRREEERERKKMNSCAACHDAQGPRQYPHLINSMLSDKNGLPAVSRSTAQQCLEYIPTSNGGQCYLNCQGVNHEPSTYP